MEAGSRRELIGASAKAEPVTARLGHGLGTTVSLMSGVQGPGMPMRMSPRQV